jgi:hypothetical protein
MTSATFVVAGCNFPLVGMKPETIGRHSEGILAGSNEVTTREGFSRPESNENSLGVELGIAGGDQDCSRKALPVGSVDGNDQPAALASDATFPVGLPSVERERGQDNDVQH